MIICKNIHNRVFLNWKAGECKTRFIMPDDTVIESVTKSTIDFKECIRFDNAIAIMVDASRINSYEEG